MDKKTKQKSHQPSARAPRTDARNQNRQGRKDIAADTLERLKDDPDVQHATANTVTYLPDSFPLLEKDRSQSDVAPSGSSATASTATSVQVWPVSTLTACQRLHQEGESDVCALNFASAKNPGGGFLKGSNAQEESLARSSGLYLCIRDSPMYALNRRDNRNCLYHHACIFSPKVPVIRDDDGRILPERYHASFLTCPAVNASIASKRFPPQTVRSEMHQRIDCLLSVAKHHQVQVLILGAFGCGVFGNDVHDVSGIFQALLASDKYQNSFRRIIFAVHSEENVPMFAPMSTEPPC